MSFLKKIIGVAKAPNVSIAVNLDKLGFASGETITGTILVNSAEAFDAKEIRIELEAIETVQRVIRKEDEMGRVKKEETQMVTNEMYKTKSPVSGPMKVTVGYKQEFPIKVQIPQGVAPTYRGRLANNVWTLKGVIAVSGRPDAVGKQEIQVASSV